MVLNFYPSPSFSICATKVFRENEKHVTRKYAKSVLILMMDGELKFMENGTEITLLPNEYYIQQDGLFQEGVPLTHPPIYFFIEFHGTYSDTNVGLPLRGTFNPTTLVPIMERCEELFRKHQTDAFNLNSYMLRIFSHLLQNEPLFDKNYNTAHLIRNYINSQYSSNLTLKSISKKFGYDEGYLSRIFKKRYGITPHKYLNQVRMEHARWLLENTDTSATQTAVAVGFDDFSLFYRNFVKTFGVSPRNVRKKAEQELNSK